jgi:hypothetical protein
MSCVLAIPLSCERSLNTALAGSTYGGSCWPDWQLELTRAHPGSLLRALIHSNGCRVVNRFRSKLPSGRVAEYSYVRYFFTNLSADIRGIFIEHCDLMGIRVTQSNHRNLTVSHRSSVAILEEVVGPKT